MLEITLHEIYDEVAKGKNVGLNTVMLKTGQGEVGRALQLRAVVGPTPGARLRLGCRVSLAGWAFAARTPRRRRGTATPRSIQHNNLRRETGVGVRDGRALALSSVGGCAMLRGGGARRGDVELCESAVDAVVQYVASAGLDEPQGFELVYVAKRVRPS